MVNENIKTKDALEEFYQDKRTENTAESTLKIKRASDDTQKASLSFINHS